jgi:N-acylneuraminate cytidylyltransferase
MRFDLKAVIPARLGSSRIENKVFSSICGKETLIERKIKQLLKVLPSENIIVNTESSLIADKCEPFGVTIHQRDPYYSDGHVASFSDVITHVVDKIDADYIAWTPFVVPFYDEQDFEASFNNFERYVISGQYDSLVSVVKMKDYIWNENGPLNYEANRNHTISQNLPLWYRVTNGNYMASKKVIMEKKYLLGDNVYLDVKEAHCGIDIDTYEDLKLAQAYHRIEI